VKACQSFYPVVSDHARNLKIEWFMEFDSISAPSANINVAMAYPKK
jgi:hypothetical protein